MDKTLTEKHSLKNIKKGTIFGYISLALNIASGFLFVPLILQQLGNQYGLFSLATSIINLFLVDFGLSSTANIFLTRKRIEGDTNGLKDIIGIFYKLYIILDLFFLVFFVGYYFLIGNIYRGLTPTEINDFRIVFIICIGYSLISLPATTLDGTISAHEEFGFLKIADLVQKIVYIILMIFVLYFRLGLFIFVLAHAVSTITAILLKYLYVRFKLNLKANLKVKLTKSRIKPILFFSIWTAIISILARFPYNLSPNILGVVSDSDNVTIFGIASTIEGYAYLVSAVIAGFFLPKVARILKQTDKSAHHELEKLAKIVGYIQLFIIGLLLAGFVACGKQFIALWIGDFEKYKMVYYGTILILFALFLIIPLTIYDNALYLKGCVKQIAIVDLISITIFVGLCFFLSHYLGAFGACLSILISKTVNLIGRMILYRKFLSVNVLSFIFSTYLRFVLPVILTSSLVFVFNNNLVSWKNLIVSIICCIEIYITLAFLFVDKEILTSLKNTLFKRNV